MHPKKRPTFFSKYHESITTTFIVAICLVLFTFFPTTGASQKMTSGIVFLGFLPLLYLKFILKKNLREFGWQLGDWKNGLLFSSFSFVGAFFCAYLLIHYTPFAKNYFLPPSALHNFWYFLFYEFFISGVFLALYEIFFRGFVQFILAKKTYFFSIFYQFFLMFLFFLVTDNLTWNNSLYLLIAIFSGLTTYKSRSLLYSFVASLFFLIILDALIIRFFR